MKFAADTSVSTEQSRAEIERTLRKYKADKFTYGWEEDRAVVAFAMNERHVRFILPLPNPKDPEFTHYKHGNSSKLVARTEAKAHAAWEQACRQRWRALNLVIKAKLEAVECGITLFEEEFLAHIVLPTGQTCGEFLIPQIQLAYDQKAMPKLLPFLGKK